MKYPERVEKYPGTLDKLAEDIGNLRYDALAEFLQLLAEKLEKDRDSDAQRGRVQLAVELHNGASALKEAMACIDNAWDICEPYV